MCSFLHRKIFLTTFRKTNGEKTNEDVCYFSRDAKRMTKIMKETKRNNYDKIMNRVGIHTLSCYTDQKLTKEDLTRIEDKDIKKSIKKCNFDTKREQSYVNQSQ